MNASIASALRPKSEPPTAVRNCCYKTARAFTPCQDSTHCCYLPPGHDGLCSCDDCAAWFEPQADGEVRFLDGELSLISVQKAM